MNVFTRLCALALAGLAACGGDEPAAPPEQAPPPLPAPLDAPVDAEGPFAAGYRSWEHAYETPAGPRTITLDVWYPTESPAGEAPVYALLFEDDDVFLDAPLARSAYPNGFPVLVHSHGSQGFGGNSSDLMRYFATHGWVVIAPNHTDNLLTGNVDPRPTRHYFERPLDVTEALDVLAELPAGDPLAGQCDLSRVAMTGHSFGVYTTWVSAGAAFDEAALEASCSNETLPAGCTEAEKAVFLEQDLSEPRISVAIGMAGGGRDGFFGAEGYNAIDVPYLLMTGTEDDVGAATLVGSIEGVDFTWVDIEGGCHQLFGLGDCPSLPNAEGFPVVNTYALAYARYHTLGDRQPRVAGIVEGTEEVSELVTRTEP